jgi:copper chaperone
MSTTTTITVTGMTCDHCVRAVRDEVSAIQGVTNVEVDLASGRVTIEAATELDPAAVAAVVDEAGYEVAP